MYHKRRKKTKMAEYYPVVKVTKANIANPSSYFCFGINCVRMHQGPVVQSTISANPRLNFNLLLWFMYFSSTVRFKTLKHKSSIDPENICGKTCSTS